MNSNIRNFCIIAHIDHGKSTLADRFLELTGTVAARDMKAQLLDSMDLERERGITIKLAPVRMVYKMQNEKIKNQNDNSKTLNFDFCILNLIDTPGHVDFNYEVSRSLAAVEGAILLVDASQGVQAQTIGNLYLALEQNLTIIPVINKIDLPIANVAKTTQELIGLLGCQPEEILLASGKTGQGVEEILQAVVARVPAPPDNSSRPPRALIFDSVFNEYKGVVAAVRLVDGQLAKGDKILLMSTQAEAEILELGYYTPKMTPAERLANGEIGYVVTGLKDVRECRVGDTITAKFQIQDLKFKISGQAKNATTPILNFQSSILNLTPLPGYREVKPMVFAGVFPKVGNEYQELREAIDKLKLNDAALIYEPEHSAALGFGFRCGFLGMLHLDIFQERLKREFAIDIVITVPSVAYRVDITGASGPTHDYPPLLALVPSSGRGEGEQGGEEKNILTIHSPQEMPDQAKIKRIFEPWMKLDIITPTEYIGSIMALVSERRGRYLTTEYLSAGAGQRALLHYAIPLASLITNFYDKLKTVTSGYGSMNYELKGYEATDVVRLDILVAEEPVEALATLVWRDEAYQAGKRIVESLKDSLPRQQFEVKIQAALGGKIIAAERLSALRKDVLAKMSGGDVTRKMKLLKKQKKGKARLKTRGSVEIPTEAYLAVLKR